MANNMLSYILQNDQCQFPFHQGRQKVWDLGRREEDCKWSYILSMERKLHRIWALPAFLHFQLPSWASPERFLNNGTFSCFNQMQFCKQFLWFSKYIKTGICSALTLERGSIEHKHLKLLVEKNNIKIPSLGLLSEKFCYQAPCQLSSEVLEIHAASSLCMS